MLNYVTYHSHNIIRILCYYPHLTATESCVRLFDVDGDGADDIIVGVGISERVMNVIDKTHTEARKYCRSIGKLG